MFLYHYSRLPITFHNYLVTSATVHNYSTRRYHSLKYYIPKYRLVRLQKSFKYIGVKIWNKIDLNIKLLLLNKFKENLQKAIIVTILILISYLNNDHNFFITQFASCFHDNYIIFH